MTVHIQCDVCTRAATAPASTHQHLVAPEALLHAGDAENLLSQVALLTLEVLDLLLSLGQFL